MSDELIGMSLKIFFSIELTQKKKKEKKKKEGEHLVKLQIPIPH
jgi:hypothetical protein